LLHFKHTTDSFDLKFRSTSIYGQQWSWSSWGELTHFWGLLNIGFCVYTIVSLR
jgi:hypothetical protein